MTRAQANRAPLRTYFTRPLLIILALGFASGLPLALTASTLAFWLAENHVDKTVIGLFAAIAVPYTLKFLWAPLLDGLRLPGLTRAMGRRRGWMLLIQLLLAGGIAGLGFTHPESYALATACAAVLVAFLSASQDIVIDAYRVEILPPDAQGQGAAMTQLGYRIGMLVSSAGALAIAAMFGWQAAYLAMAASLGIGIAATLLAHEPEVPAEPTSHAPLAWLGEFVVGPFVDFTRHRAWLLIFIFIVVYKLADAFIGIMTNPFFYEIGFSKLDIAGIVKVYGTVATLLGIAAGGAITAKFGTFRTLFFVGLLHALTNLLYVVQAHIGANPWLLGGGIFVENFTGAVSSIAFVAFLSRLCNLHYTATQYALLSALAAFGRVWLATPAGYVAKALGWEGFFAFSAFLAVPGLLLLWYLRKADAGALEEAA